MCVVNFSRRLSNSRLAERAIPLHGPLPCRVPGRDHGPGPGHVQAQVCGRRRRLHAAHGQLPCVQQRRVAVRHVPLCDVPLPGRVRRPLPAGVRGDGQWQLWPPLRLPVVWRTRLVFPGGLCASNGLLSLCDPGCCVESHAVLLKMAIHEEVTPSACKCGCQSPCGKCRSSRRPEAICNETGAK